MTEARELAVASTTRSPWQSQETVPCGLADAALTRVAARVAHERDFDVDRLTDALRREGSPYVRPRLVRTSSSSSSSKLADLRTETSRCGVASITGDDHVVAIVVEPIADLDDLPVRARTGQWLTLSAKLHRPIAGAKVYVLGPHGPPRTVPAALDGDQVRARFALDRPGAFQVQLVGDLATTGPQPLLEARVFADVSPHDDADVPLPGEEAGDDAATLERMTNALRRSESLAPLRRQSHLDAIAQSHAETMKTQRTLAHRIEGDLHDRLGAAGIEANVIGENVARAKSLVRAHRALHASPSHRANLLGAKYTQIGIGIARDGDLLYICEVFVS